MVERTPGAAEDVRDPESRDDTPACPLHFAMQQLAHAAVAQLVFYAHGEYAPRPDLMRDLDRWQQLHRLIVSQVCPASRSTAVSPAELQEALAMIPEGQFGGLRAMLRRCASGGHGDACPLEQASDVRLFEPK